MPGCLDMVNFWEPDTVPEKYRDRQLYSWAPNVTLMRTDEAENRTLGREIARKLRGANATIVFPTQGISQIDAEGEIFHNPVANQALFAAIRENRDENTEILEVEAHINEAAFAKILVEKLMGKLGV